MTMHDAEIAVTLMNRWAKGTGQHGDVASPFDLLREGGLRFTLMRSAFAGAHDVETVLQAERKTAVNQSAGATAASNDGASPMMPMEIECLAFEDGSRALRLVCRAAAHHRLTPWAAVAPLEPLAHAQADLTAEPS